MNKQKREPTGIHRLPVLDVTYHEVHILFSCLRRRLDLDRYARAKSLLQYCVYSRACKNDSRTEQILLSVGKPPTRTLTLRPHSRVCRFNQAGY